MILINAAAIGIHTRFQAHGSCFFKTFRIKMSSYNVVDGTTVAGHVTIQTVCFSGNGIHQKPAGRNRNTVYSIVGSHNGRKFVFPDEFSVRCQIEFPHIPVVHVRTAGVAVEFGIICQIMLSARNSFQVNRIIAHHSPDKSFAYFGNKKRVFTERFGCSSPSRVARRLNHR